MPTTFFFDLLRETDQEFVVRTGWFYRHDQHIHIPDPSIQVRPPCLPVGSPEVVSQFYFRHRSTLINFFTRNIPFKGEVLCAFNFLISSTLTTWTEQFVKGSLMKQEVTTWFIKVPGELLLCFKLTVLRNIFYFLCHLCTDKFVQGSLCVVIFYVSTLIIKNTSLWRSMHL